MKKLLPLLGLLIALTGFVNAPVATRLYPVHRVEKHVASVYVCMSKSSLAYHNRDNCAGLNRCNHEVKSMSVDDAQNLGKRECMKCY